jgi:hypothetical protein
MQLCVVNRATRQYGSHPTSDLLGVDYWYAVPPDTEFPWTIPRLDLFVRFLVAGLGPTAISVRVFRLADDGGVLARMCEYQFTVPFDPADRVREQSFRLPNVPLTGEGLYAVRVGRPFRHRWKGPRWRPLGTDYFYVVR